MYLNVAKQYPVSFCSWTRGICCIQSPIANYFAKKKSSYTNINEKSTYDIVDTEAMR